MTTLLHTELSDGILTVTLNRRAAQNALVPALLAQVTAAMNHAAGDDAVRAVLLQSASDAFSIGGDMHAFNRHFPDIRAYAKDIVGKLNQTMLAMIDLPKPIVTAVHGPVTGGSMGFVLASDLVLVSPQAVFKAHYPSAGFSPDGGWGVLLPRLIGARRAAECLLLNRSITAEQAVEWGIANRLVESAALLDDARKMALKIARYPAGTMRTSKQLLWRERAQIAADLDLELAKFVELITADGTQQLVQAFLNTYRDYPPETADTI